MNNNCIFSTLLFCHNWTVEDCLITCKQYNSLSTVYLWDLLCRRDYKNIYIKVNDKKGYDKYVALERFDELQWQNALWGFIFKN